MRRLSCFTAAAAVLLSAGCQRSAHEGQIRDFVNSFVYESLALSPTDATSQGYHEHRGAKLDELWGDYSPAGIERRRNFYDGAVRDADTLRDRRLMPELTADLDVIKLTAESQALDLERIQPYRHNPTVYVEEIGNGLYSPFILNYAP